MSAGRPRIAHGLFTWRDGRTALEACLRSTAGVVDEVLIADGKIAGVNADGSTFSELGWLVDADYLPASVPINAREWPALSDACTWLLCKAQELRCDWLLFVDGDQELHNSNGLRDWLRTYRGQVAYPIARVDNGLRRACPWQCVNVHRLRRYVAGCFVVELDDGSQLSLVPQGDTRLRPLRAAPWLSHHPERRPPERYRHRLGELETVLEPPPYGLPALQLSAGLIETAP